MDRKKELLEQYRQMKPEMGIFMIRSMLSNNCHLESTKDLKGTINSSKFKLGAGNHPNRALQKDWQAGGAANFTIEILEQLDYSKDEAKTDYTDELTIMHMIWEEKLANEKMNFYKK